jgi:broad specificity phosphatase PhoE
MRIFLVRHAQPAWIVEGRGRNDPHLTDLGLRQASALADALGQERFDAAWISPALRARQTAAPLLERLGMEPRLIHDLREVGTPDYEKESPETIRQRMAEARFRPVEAWWDGYPGGEAIRPFCDRVSGAISTELHALGGRVAVDSGERIWTGLPHKYNVLVVSHAGTSGAALAALLGVPQAPWPWQRFRLGHAGYALLHASLVAHGAVWALDRFNDQEHLEPADRTT